MNNVIGVLGLGELGGAICERLLASGFAVAGFDPDPARATDAAAIGVQVDNAPVGVAALATEVVLLVVGRGEHALDACTGSGGCLTEIAGKTLVVMSSLDPAVVRMLEKGVEDSGGLLLDVPSGGGAPAAAKGELALMVSGKHQALAAAGPVLAVLGSSTTFFGDKAGSAQAAKLVTQVGIAVNLVAVHEATRLGAALGLSIDQIVTALVASSGTSFVAENWATLASFIGQGHVANISKDLRTLLDLVGPGEVPAPLARAALDAFVADWPLERSDE